MYSSHYLAQAKRDLFCTPTSAFQVLGLQTYATIPDQTFCFSFYPYIHPTFCICSVYSGFPLPPI